MKLLRTLICLVGLLGVTNVGRAAPNCSSARITIDQSDLQARQVQRLLAAALAAHGRKSQLVDPDLALALKGQSLCYRATLTWWDGGTLELGNFCATASSDAFGRAIAPNDSAWQKQLVEPLMSAVDDATATRWNAAIQRRDRTEPLQTLPKLELSTRIQTAADGTENVSCLARGLRLIAAEGECQLIAESTQPNIKFGEGTHTLTRFARWIANGRELGLGESVPLKAGATAQLKLELSAKPPGREVTFSCARSDSDAVNIDVQAEGATIQPPSGEKSGWSGNLVRKDEHGVIWAKLALANSKSARSIALTFEPTWYERLWGWLVALFAANWLTVEGVKALVKKLLSKKAAAQPPWLTK